MSDEQHDRLSELFEQAVELPPDARDAFIGRCTDDLALRGELRSLLAALDVVAANDAVSGGATRRALASSPREQDLIGTMLAHYRVVSHLGSGGMGDVYVARDTVLDRS